MGKRAIESESVHVCDWLSAIASSLPTSGSRLPAQRRQTSLVFAVYCGSQNNTRSNACHDENSATTGDVLAKQPDLLANRSLMS